MMRNWIRVTRHRCCQICGKPDWCSKSVDGRVAICMRIESKKQTKNGGYIHRLTDDWQPPRRPAQRKPLPKVQRDWKALVTKYHLAMTDAGWRILSDELGLSIATMKTMKVGWDGSQSRYMFPMRNDAGDIVGIRTREQDSKRSVSGSDGNGLFFIPALLVSDYLIVCEGPTDMAALVDAGFGSTIGKPSCKLGDKYVVEIIRQLNPDAVLLIPDADAAGLEGFSILANEILQGGVLSFDKIDSLTPPQPLKDVRQWLRKNREHLGGRIAVKLHAVKQRTGGSSNV